MDATSPDVFAYLDFRAFLGDGYRWRKTQDRRFSHRLISSKAGATSPSWFLDVLKGRVRLNDGHIVRLAQTFRLSPKETGHFENLVHYGQAADPEAKRMYRARVLAAKDLDLELMGRERFEFYGAWYHATLRELLFFHDYTGDPAALGRKLIPPIGKEQAVKSLDLLLRLGLISKQAGGHFRPTSANIIKDSRFKSDHIDAFIKASLDLARDACERIPAPERDLSSVTLSLSPEGFAELKTELKAFRSRLLAISDRHPHPNKVYQCNLHVFPTTR